MAKKKNNVSINALERFSSSDHDNVVQRTLKNGDVEISYEVRRTLSFEECVKFVEDVVNECVVPNDTLIIPVSKDFMIKKGLMTYYANFTMPTNMVKAFELVTASGDIIEDIESIIDNSQYLMILDSIVERIDFEKKKMLSAQEAKVNHLVKEVASFMDKMASLFENIDGEQMAQFISKMSQIKDLSKISEKELASVIVEAATEKN